jgi:hypothetical protein
VPGHETDAVSRLQATAANGADDLPDTIDGLRDEVLRLRELVGPEEKSYLQLKLDLLGARDHAIGAEAEASRLRAEVGPSAEWQRKAEELDAVYRSKTWRLGWTLTAPLRFTRRVTGSAR